MIPSWKRWRRAFFLGAQRSTVPTGEQEGKFVFRIVLLQGAEPADHRYVPCALGLDAQGIKRVRVANITIGKLKPGNYRLVTGEELEELYGMLHS